MDDPALAIGGWSAEFLSPAAERAYRRYAWPETARAVRVAVFALVALIWVFVYSDYLFVGWTPLLALLLGVRLFTTILCGWILVETRHYRGRVAVERLLPWWLAAGAVLTLVIAATRPGNYLFQATLMVVEVFGIYIFTPMALRTVMALCSLACALFVAMMVARGGLEPPQILTLAMSFALANFLGYVTARRLHRLRRGDFANRLAERRARRRLETEIAERRQVERALIDANRAADEANRAKSAFLAAMSHEIRTPLTGVLGFAQLLAETALTPVQRAHVQVIERSGRNLTRLLNDILDLSKVEAGRIQIETQAFDLFDTIDTTIRLVEPRARAAGVVIKVARTGARADARLLGDADRLQQVVTNLLDNAIKFAGGAPVALSVALTPNPSGSLVDVRIEVADRGPGVAAELRPLIFEPYVHTPNAGASGAGAGLGLAISRRLIEAMGGAIALADRPGGGSIFRVDLSLARPKIQEAPAEPTAPVLAAGPSLSVLLVDDDEVNRLLISTVLGRDGHRVSTAVDGRQGVDMALARRFDVVLMDIRMPVMDGGEAIRLLRADTGPTTRDLPIFAMTANVMDTEVETYLGLGASAVLSKPVDFARLRALLAGIAPEPAAPGAPEPEDEALFDPDLIESLSGAIGPAATIRALDQFNEAAGLLLDAQDSALVRGNERLARHWAGRLAQAADSLGLGRVAARARAARSGGRAEIEDLIARARVLVLARLGGDARQDAGPVAGA